MVSPQCWATIRGTMVRDSDGHGEPRLQVFASHLPVRNIMGWLCEVLPVLQQPLCSLPVFVGAMWLYDRQL